MSQELICNWLGLSPEEAWPPNHYRLLGLQPGESDAELIEQRVHQRLDSVRAYQMTHPEEATEAMNRLAQAFVCLTEPAAKQVYDATLLGRPTPAPPQTPPSPRQGNGPVPGTIAEPPDPLEWLYNPASLGEELAPSARRGSSVPPPLPVVPPPLPPDWPPVRPAIQAPQPPPLPTPPPPAPPPPAPPASPAPVQAEQPAPPPPEPVDPLVEAARSPQARRGLRTRRALLYRILRTRHLLRLWARVGKYLSSPKRRMTRPAEAADLSRHLEEILHLLQHFPPLMGEAGQPGYLVLNLADVDPLLPTFQALDLDRREALSRDWQAGQKLLTSYRDFLREEVRVMRQHGFKDRLVLFVRSYLKEQPGTALLLLLALLALGIALGRTYLRH